jgi:hypothetical protein
MQAKEALAALPCQSNLLRAVTAMAQGLPVEPEVVVGLLEQSRAIVGLLNDYSCEETLLAEADSVPMGGVNHAHLQGLLTTADDLVRLAVVALQTTPRQ